MEKVSLHGDGLCCGLLTAFYLVVNLLSGCVIFLFPWLSAVPLGSKSLHQMQNKGVRVKGGIGKTGRD